MRVTSRASSSWLIGQLRTSAISFGRMIIPRIVGPSWSLISLGRSRLRISTPDTRIMFALLVERTYLHSI
jgi:hypothetical protein